MTLRKFVASTMKEALEQVKQELGADAMVVSTRPIRRGLLGSAVEVTAAIDIDEPSTPHREGPTSMGPRIANAPSSSSAVTMQSVDQLLQPIRAEIRSLRSLFRPTGDGGNAALRSELEAIRRAVASIAMPNRTSEPTEPLEVVAARTEIARASEKRVIVLVGPTGVGKTTTIAKLAARKALVDHRSVELLTLDTFRIGGEEQIRTFADLIGVPVQLIGDPTELQRACANSRADCIFIDTAGRSRNDVAEIETLKRALGEVCELELHLTVTTMTPASEIDAWARRFAAIGVDRLLFTKLDECDDLSQLVLGPARTGAPVSFVTTGQRVPEDIELVDHRRLLELAQRGYAQAQVAA